MAVKRSKWFAFVRSLVRNFFFKSLGGITTVGEENIPLEGAIIFAPNHVSHLDPPIMACAQNRRQLTFMSKEEMFKIPVLGPIIRSLGAFPIRRGESDTESIRKAISLLEEGRAVLIFPEGTRGDGQTFQSINRGVAVLAKRTGALVLPIGVVGTHIVWPKGKARLKRNRMIVAFGKPFTYAEAATSDNEKENREAFANEITKRIVELCRANGMPLKTSTELEPQSPALSQ